MWLCSNAVPGGSSRRVRASAYSQPSASTGVGGSSSSRLTVSTARPLSSVAAGYVSVYPVVWSLSKLMYSYEGPSIAAPSGRRATGTVIVSRSLPAAAPTSQPFQARM